MALLIDLWNDNPEQLEDKQVQQIIAFSGAGKLIDGSVCANGFRSFLENVPSKKLAEYAYQCLSQSFTDSGMALQDIVNEIGSRLGAEITRGRYKGKVSQNGFDGLWRFPNKHAIVIEVKTTDAYRIDLNVVANYRKLLISSQEITEGASSMLLVVGRQDTGDLEAQIRGSRHAWDLRIISVSALLRLMSIMEDMEDPVIVQRIHSILIPREFTRLDDIAEILFSAAEEIKQEVVPVDDEEEDQGGDNQTKEKKFIPVAFHEACISRIQVALKEKLVKRSRAQYSTPEKTIIVNCAISKEHHPDTKPGYWFAFHPYQREALKQAEKAFVAFGCGTSKRVILMPFTEFDLLLDGMNVTQKDDRMYWHISIERKEERYFLHRKRGHKVIELTPFVLPTED